MPAPESWPAIEALRTERLALDPLRVDDADAMATVLGDAALYAFTGGEAPSAEQLRRRYAAQVVGQSADGGQGWLNWIVRLRSSGEHVGYVQASVDEQDGARVAEAAWVIGVAHQGQGYAVESAAAMIEWLAAQQVRAVVAHVHPQHEASMLVAARVGLSRTDRTQDGEVRWERTL